jgi:hypothetical protein
LDLELAFVAVVAFGVIVAIVVAAAVGVDASVGLAHPIIPELDVLAPEGRVEGTMGVYSTRGHHKADRLHQHHLDSAQHVVDF